MGASMIGRSNKRPKPRRINAVIKRIVELATGERFTETNKQLAALAQIYAAIWLFQQNELECAVTLAGAAEGVIPPTLEPHMFLVLKNALNTARRFHHS
jgi:hypothetical protein